MGSITVSPKHGVNPALMVCPICHHETNGLALMGRLPGDAEAPRFVMDREPCGACMDIINAGGVVVIEVADGEEDKKHPKRTGRIVGVKRHALQEAVVGVDVSKTYSCLIPESVLKDMMGEELYRERFSQAVDGAKADN